MDSFWQDKSHPKRGVDDPDPWIIVQTFLVAAGLLLQFRSFGKGSSVPSDVIERHVVPMRTLEEAIENALADFDQLIRIVERDETNPEAHLFSAPFGLQLSSMFFEKAAMKIYQKRQTAAFQALTTLSIHVYSMITDHPNSATMIGTAMLRELGDSADQLNRLVRDGAPNRQLIAESRNVLERSMAILAGLSGGRALEN